MSNLSKIITDGVYQCLRHKRENKILKISLEGSVLDALDSGTGLVHIFAVCERAMLILRTKLMKND